MLATQTGEPHLDLEILHKKPDGTACARIPHAWETEDPLESDSQLLLKNQWAPGLLIDAISKSKIEPLRKRPHSHPLTCTYICTHTYAHVPEHTWRAKLREISLWSVCLSIKYYVCLCCAHPVSQGIKGYTPFKGSLSKKHWTYADLFRIVNFKSSCCPITEIQECICNCR